jgi:hypothetical protein
VSADRKQGIALGYERRDGEYVLAMDLGGEYRQQLSRLAAEAMAAQLVEAAICAEYESAICHQLSMPGDHQFNAEELAGVIYLLRTEAGYGQSLDTTDGIVFGPVVDAAYAPSVGVYLNGGEVGSIRTTEARHRASAITAAAICVELNNSYRRVLASNGVPERAIHGGITDIWRNRLPTFADLERHEEGRTP